MKDVFVLSLTLLAFCGCGEREVKSMIIEPHPPAKVENASSCHLHFSKEGSLQETAIQGARISDECSLNEKEFQDYAKQELTEKN